jgi:hypothetical protein
MLRRVPFLLALLPWLLFGHGAPRRAGGEDRVLSVVSLVDGTSHPATRVDDSQDVIRSLVAARRTLKLPVGHSAPLDVVPLATIESVSLREQGGARINCRWRAPRAKRLTVPHDANAPPTRQS